MSGSPLICVVIPFYQRTPCTLVRAINSVLAQDGVARPYVLIVDDGSPCSAREIVREHFPGGDGFIHVITQRNGGAAKARNTGLDNLPEETSYVAFLDSDDEWTCDHLSNALSALGSGCDFYFAGHKREDWESDRFTQMGLSLAQHECIDSKRTIFKYVGDILVPVLGKQMVKTSSVVYRAGALGDIRFPEELVLGEDEVFWMKAMRRARACAFGAKVEVRMGRGINISQGGQWGGEESIRLMLLNLRKWKRLPALLGNEPCLTPLARAKVRELRRELAACVLHRARRRQRLPIGQIASFTRADPAWLLSLWAVLFQRIVHA